MSRNIRTQFQKGDILAIIIVLVTAAAVALMYLPRQPGADAVVEIYQDGVLLQTCSLDEELGLTVQGRYTNVIKIGGGSAAIIASDCPGEDCVHSGEVRASGRSVVCLPNGVELRVVSAQQDVDFVVR